MTRGDASLAVRYRRRGVSRQHRAVPDERRRTGQRALRDHGGGGDRPLHTRRPERRPTDLVHGGRAHARRVRQAGPGRAGRARARDHVQSQLHPEKVPPVPRWGTLLLDVRHVTVRGRGDLHRRPHDAGRPVPDAGRGQIPPHGGVAPRGQRRRQAALQRVPAGGRTGRRLRGGAPDVDRVRQPGARPGGRPRGAGALPRPGQPGRGRELLSRGPRRVHVE